MKKLVGVIMAICLALSIFLPTPFESSAEATRTAMTGDYSSDTISVVKSLKETIAIPADDEGRPSAQTEAVTLITDYISRYRNRPQFNESNSFTTMQTALNALAGHYRNYAKRPLSEELKERVNNELTKAEKLVNQDS